MMMKADEDKVRKIFYEELTCFLRHVSSELAKADGRSGE